MGLMAVSLAATTLLLPRLHALAHVPGVGMWMLAVAFGVAEALPVHFEHRREAVSITLTTVPLVVGLFAVAPVALIAAHLLGTTAVLVVRRRQQVLKLTMNLASFWVQTIVSVVVFRALGHDSVGPGSWPGVLVAVLAGDAAQTVVLTSAICLYQRRWEGSLRATAVVSSIAALVQTSVGLVAVSLLLTQPAALLPLAVVTALVLLSLRTHRSLGERHRELGQLYEFTSAMGDAQLDGRVLTTLLVQARDVMHAERAWLYLDDGDGGLLSTSTESHTGELERAGAGADAIYHAAHAAARPIVISAADTLHRDVLQAAEAVDLLIAPLAGSSGGVGTLVVADRSGQVRGFGVDDARLFATLANHASVALENDRLVERLREKARESEHQSLHDALTGLPNRVLFARRLEDALTSGSAAAVLLLDLDRFKEVNDTLGHHNGDLLLQQVGQRLRKTLRTGDVIARLGGDEFAVLLPDINAEHAALQAGRGIIELLEQPFVIDDMSVDVGASIGVAVAPRDGADPVTLVQRADVAMYTAKSDQTGVEMYRAERDGYSPARLMLVSELKHAVQQHQLDVHYQPQVDLQDGSVIGVEALVRWNHPTRGTVRPDEFIPVAEHTGLIRPLTLFVLDEALGALNRWRTAGHTLRMSVNLSARSLLQPALVDDVAALLRRHNILEGALCLEVTESSIMSDPRRTVATLEALRDLGVTISIDDFGTGHSSLAYIKRLPVGEIKIDKSFVVSMLADHSDDTIVGAVVNLGTNLGISVVAEGVEDDATRARLEEIGCPSAQGYLFGRPMPGGDVLAWLADRSSARRDCVIVPLDRGARASIG
jgi:diguanylate cyclase (GGDEF)-like protein